MKNSSGGFVFCKSARICVSQTTNLPNDQTTSLPNDQTTSLPNDQTTNLPNDQPKLCYILGLVELQRGEVGEGGLVADVCLLKFDEGHTGIEGVHKCGDRTWN